MCVQLELMLLNQYKQADIPPTAVVSRPGLADTNACFCIEAEKKDGIYGQRSLCVCVSRSAVIGQKRKEQNRASKREQGKKKKIIITIKLNTEQNADKRLPLTG